MRAVQVEEFGGPEVLVVRDLPEPEVGPGQALVEVAAANVMYLDTLVRGGWGLDYFPVTPPYVPGAGVAGRVVRIGPGVDPGWEGAAVVADTGHADGTPERPTLPVDGYAERAVVPESALVRVPEEVDPRAALALLHDGPTALALERAAGFGPSTTVLVAAAAGGAGTLAVQLARRAGARVIGAARGGAKLALVRELGAQETVDYSEPDWPERVRALTGGAGVDVVLDGAGGALGAAAFGTLADGGRFVGYGSAGGSFTEVDTEEAGRRGIEVLGLFDLKQADGDRQDALRMVLEMARMGRITPHVGLALPLERAAEAHAALEGRAVLGKALLIP
ncbi:MULTISPECIES: zinc-binding dehydrogenase [Nocardiopsis]|uniref:Alcohol dehydrogenase zinc-binding domain protein n=1 Tax=Nocardiopsis dassonvillei (strain ATCC 23218 / DSM 43111 / CIP 107115 / JCM 7437 / KCTC 9190 / NBRC 14626 / NCTC 10488 / NRRL B-5397 / IMRU 509) TaxID=446468 RepID=D7B265_NOCDD|nr:MULTISPECIES: zinc-binding dehydrogenase [Nocardiopsis]ADH68522.1 Alcohol dehydrogenase zinc-binding domain protein [Nocardiopsis dassonvillei subsp. dassonvillei DSM 43111]APC36602.1 NADPH:quinone reductase [Nocardiopsis dassonvillei]NKY80899.1 zinc-binding dehydrogenase [Nocardiopsis dassonvillei]VEI89030.1 Quinone oxidoreductase 1 [Nocardiopsis dassonvillei]